MHTPAWELFPYERSTIFVREPSGASRMRDARSPVAASERSPLDVQTERAIRRSRRRP